VVTHDYPDQEKPPPGSHCQGGVITLGLCLFPAHGNLIYDNFFTGDGFFGNVTNGDLATVGLLPNSATPRNCYFGNLATGTLTSEPKNIQNASVDGRPCGTQGTSADPALVGQLICATGATGLGIPCPAGSHYPKQTRITLAPLRVLPTMPAPCAGVPANGFCARRL
jgi:hypothetical protein